MNGDYICFGLPDKFPDLACLKFMNDIGFWRKKPEVLIEVRNMIMSKHDTKEYGIAV